MPRPIQEFLCCRCRRWVQLRHLRSVDSRTRSWCIACVGEQLALVDLPHAPILPGEFGALLDYLVC